MAPSLGCSVSDTSRSPREGVRESFIAVVYPKRRRSDSLLLCVFERGGGGEGDLAISVSSFMLCLPKHYVVRPCTGMPNLALLLECPQPSCAPSQGCRSWPIQRRVACSALMASWDQPMLDFLTDWGASSLAGDSVVREVMLNAVSAVLQVA
jgi:hypothetical protein